MEVVALTEGAPSQTAAAVRRAPEVLAPAGDWDAIRAAIANGADAVYFGLQEHNARHRATNFAVDELPRLCDVLHRHAVRGYVTLNTLVFPRELPELERLVREVAAAGADAILVQDLGLARLARAVCPDLSLHASTQMTLTSAENIRVAVELGIERVVAAREMSLDDLRRIGRASPLPLEVFVHGALCVAYSGQCLTSEALGGRSANRGQCAQACRLPYELVCDGQTRDLGDVKYLLSPQDLAAFELIPRLVELGVVALKIEGRLKTADYVANITRYYRRAVDAAVSGQVAVFERRDVEEMELSFSRGFSPGWLAGNDHKRLVVGRSPKKRGVFLGEVVSVRGRRIDVQLASPVKRGDGVVFDSGRPESEEPGGRVYEVFQSGRSLETPVASGRAELAFGREFDARGVEAGQRVWKTDDPDLTRRLRKTYTGAGPLRRVPLDVHYEALAGRPLRIAARAANGAQARLESDIPLQLARKHPLTDATLREQLGRLGGTLYELRALAGAVEGQPMLPLSALGRLRHAMVSQLDASLGAAPPRAIARDGALDLLRSSIRQDECSTPAPTLRVLCRDRRQLRRVLDEGVREVYLDFQDIREYAAAVRTAAQSGASAWLATPRIQKPAEGPIFRYLAKAGAAGILARNLAAVRYFAARGAGVVADFSLNAANELTVDVLLAWGAQRVTASYDLNAEQLIDLAQRAPAARLEVVLHQHMPLFHMEHCVFCAVLSPGANRTNCGRPCDRHDVRLRDRVGKEHRLTADVGCRNTLFNATPQSAAEHGPRLLAEGLRHFRVELLDEDDAAIARTIELYARLLRGEVTGRHVWTSLRAMNHVGVTRGPQD